jgi:hypothetical protein
MSVTTIYKCDKCGAVQNTDNQFWTIGVTAKSRERTSDSFVQGKSMEVCRPCLESFGLFVSKKIEEAPEYNPPTLEELIREIIRNEVDR